MAESRAIVPSTPPLAIQVGSVNELTQLAKVFAASGLFGKGGDPNAQIAQCAVQLMAGMEAGFTPFASITGVYLVKGRPAFSAQMLAQAIKRHPEYDYRVLEKTDKCCRIKFLSRGEELGVETFSIQMAERAGLIGAGPWKQYPEAMLFARCLSAGMRTHCPDALGGHTPYTAEELGADVDVQVIPDPAPAAAPAAPAAVTPEQAEQACLQAGLTPDGIVAFCDELKGVSSLADLDQATLAKLVKAGVSAATVERCNAAAEAVAAATAGFDDDDLPATWDA